MYAVVGREFNLYYDAFTLLPEYGPGTPNLLFNIICSKGSMAYRSYRFTLTSADISSYPFTYQYFDNKGTLIETVTSTLVVVAAANPGTVKNVLEFGDSTIDEGTVTKTLQENLAAIGGNVPLFFGQHHPGPFKNEARTGRAYANFAGAAGTVAYKFYLTGVPTNWDLSNIRNTYYWRGTSANTILMSERWKINPDGTGWAIGYYFSPFTLPSTLPATLTASNAPGFPATLNVTGAEVLNNFSIFKNAEGVGTLDIGYYRTDVLGMAASAKFHAVHVDLGINDVSTGALLTDAQATAIIDNAKLLIAAFLADNASCRIVISLPKSCTSDYFDTTRRHGIFRFNIHKLRKYLLAAFDGNASYPNVLISQNGYSVDRYYGYPQKTDIPIAARMASLSTKLIGTTDDVHPRPEGSMQSADGLTGCMLYALSLS